MIIAIVIAAAVILVGALYWRGIAFGRRESAYDKARAEDRAARNALLAAQERRHQAEEDLKRQEAARDTVKKESADAEAAIEEDLAAGRVDDAARAAITRARAGSQRARKLLDPDTSGGIDPSPDRHDH